MTTMGFDRLGRERVSGIRQLARRALIGATPSSRLTARVGARWPAQWTFDDGPDPVHTPALLDLLAANNLLAAFFLIGEAVERQPDLARRIHAEGHLIGSHSHTHPERGALPGGAYLSDVRRGREVIEATIGVAVPAFRPPHGYLSPRLLWRLLTDNWQVVLWSVDPKDYAIADAEFLVDRLEASAIQKSDVVLLHDTAPATAAGLAQYLSSINTSIER